MAKATQSRSTSKTKVIIKPKIPDGFVQCNVCNGKGYHKKPNRKK